MGSAKKTAEWFEGFNRGYRSGTESLLSTIKGFSDGLDEKADQAVEALDDRCFCEDCLSADPIVFDSGDDADALQEPPSAEGVTGFVVCVDGEPFVDTFRVDPSLAREAFLPILEADPSLANEEIRLVRLEES